jgi:hypothetical protein
MRNGRSGIVNDRRVSENGTARIRDSQSDCAKGKLESRNCKSVRRKGYSAHLDYKSAISRSRVSGGPYIQIP